MTKNLILVMVGIVIGAFAMRFFDSSPDTASSDSAQQLTPNSLTTSAESPGEVTQPGFQQGVDLNEVEILPTEEVAAELNAAEVIVENSTTSIPAETASVIEIGNTETEGQTADNGLPAGTDNIGLPPLLPEQYHFMFEQPADRPITPTERATLFAAEARDETWAYTMELGISQHAAVATPVGTVIEYVECRASACMMAGYIQPGFEDGTGALIEEMRQTGWWQLGGETISLSRGQNGQSRFVSFMNREDVGEPEPVPVEPGQEEVEIRTQDQTDSGARA